MSHDEKRSPSPIARDPLAAYAIQRVGFAVAFVLAAAIVGASVRLLPWALDPTVAWSTLAPFAKSLFAVAVEAAILTGWPVGWAIATQRLVDRGEARVLASLGEAPLRTLARLGPQAAALAVVLAATSALLGREAAAPGRVVDALLAKGRATCEGPGPPATYAVPFVSATWICPRADDDGDGAAAARLVGRAPIGDVVFTARAANVSDDLRRIDLADAQLVTAPSSDANANASARARVSVHVRALSLHGMAPWARASAVPPALRAALVTLSALLAGAAAALSLLRLGERGKHVNGVVAVALGATGPLAALASLRALEVRVPDGPLGGAWAAAFALVPLVAGGAVVLGAAVVAALPESRRAGTK